VATEKQCPRCEQALLDQVASAGGAAAYVCPGDGCGFTLPVGVRRRAAPCPRCGGVMLARRDGGEAAWTCARATCGHRVAPTVAAGG